ncbi:hypothetical protein FHU33_0958 [Blastococcus colisei]|uniref:Uncharacterized protein n=1 Tax=Blastococcus colisei TaxID=1564162 RepID=A0A543PBX0_9ACTN|nr:hypothetical protein [Blastococcus colisei]TQN41589.1 hypothetical protein FHU33_0958 [Blastococcus colisei]
MPASQPELHIHPPLWARLWIVVFLPAWLWIVVQQSDGPGMVGWLVAAFGLALGARMFVMGAVGTSDGRLTVRNQFTTRTFHRDELADAVVDRAHGRLGTGWTVWLLLHNGSRHHVQLTEAPFRPGFNRALERHAARLRAWIHAPGRPQAFL